jgi:hypothetical protein
VSERETSDAQSLSGEIEALFFEIGLVGTIYYPHTRQNAIYRYIVMAPAKELDELRWINRALADGEARIKKQREIIADLDLLGADCTRAKTVLDVMLSAQAERERYREMLLGQSTENELGRAE